MSKNYYVYILTNGNNTVLYTGVTAEIAARIQAHNDHKGCKFTANYNATRLVFVEVFDCPYSAILREKELKGLGRQKKLKLIGEKNPCWNELKI